MGLIFLASILPNDLIQESGIEIVPFNFGGHTNDPTYKDEGTRVWYQAAKMIRESQIAAPPRYHPDTAKLCAQLSSRRQKTHSTGKLWMESKDEMRARGIKSPDAGKAEKGCT